MHVTGKNESEGVAKFGNTFFYSAGKDFQAATNNFAKDGYILISL